MQQLRRPLTTAIGVAITREVLRGNYPTCVRPGGQVQLPSEALQCMDEPVVPAEATKGGRRTTVSRGLAFSCTS